MTFGSFFWVMATPIWIAVVHCILNRIGVFKKVPRQKAAALSGLAVVLASLLILWPQTISEGLFILVCSSLLAHIYFHFFNMSETARRIQILTRLKTGQAMTGDEYGADQMIRIRLERLVDLNQVGFQDGKYSSRTSLLSVVARIMTFYERVLFPGRKI